MPQSRPVDHLVVVDNGNEESVRTLVGSQPVPSTYLGSQNNLGGAGGFAFGMLHALSIGADWVWSPTTTAGPKAATSSPPCWDARCATGSRRCRRWCATSTTRIGSRSRSAVVWSGGVAASELGDVDLLPGIASLFNGALLSAAAIEAVGVPDLRLFVRGDEVDVHRRLVRSGLPFGTCLRAAYLHPKGTKEFKPILGGRMHAQYPDDPTKRFFTYRNRGYLMSLPGMR